MITLKTLLNTLPQIGELCWIGLRPSRKTPMLCVPNVDVSPENGLHGDRYSGQSGLRQVTLIQAEHMAAIGGVLGQDPVSPDLLRRNLVVRGINLLALKDRDVHLGSALIRVTGLCHPCSRMEATLGPGGYNAVRGHGGITARVLTAGQIKLGDQVRVVGSAK
ncbi:MAG: MOSC domain-containing protein [Pseudomonadota bacterium]